MIVYFKYIAYELAHLWWCKSNPNSWEDLLNESFAEYSVRMELRKVFGEVKYAAKIDKWRFLC